MINQTQSEKKNNYKNEALSSPLVSYFCDWAVFTLSGGEQLEVQHPAKCYSSSLMFDLHPSLPDGVHGPFYNFFYEKREKKL